MRILIRADASPVIGSGHVMRCLALAEVFVGAGHEVLFATRAREKGLLRRMSNLGVSIVGMSAAPPANGMDDFAEMAAHGMRRPVDWIVVDHYGLGLDWQRSARSAARVLVIDDSLERARECDLFVNQNYYSCTPNSRPDGGAHALIGPRYALLRKEFLEKRDGLQPRKSPIRRTLIYFGNSDDRGATLKAIAAIRRHRTIAADVVVGTMNPSRERICRAASGSNIVVHVGEADMPQLMAAADLSIGGGGVSTWERCCMGLPSIVVATSDNQYRGAVELDRDGYIEFAGRVEDCDERDLFARIADFNDRPDKLLALSRKALELVDGRGASRVFASMLAPSLTLRAAEERDCDDVLRWRNDPRVRANSLDSRAIETSAHREWFAKRIRDPNCLFLLAEVKDKVLGVLRYDIQGSAARVSIFMAPEYVGKGLGRYLLNRGTAYLQQKHPDVVEIVADVLVTNEPSKRVFAAAGYVPDGERFRLSLRSSPCFVHSVSARE